MEISVQKTLLDEFDLAWKEFHNQVLALEESLIKRQLLFHIDKYIDWYPFSELISLQNVVDIFYFLVLKLEDSELVHGAERIRGLLEALCDTLMLQEAPIG